ncbi:MAG: type II methionyl aminopeptidase [Candidatus Aenigmatarchaeota archaeon]
MDEEVLRKYRRAGEIAAKAREFGKGLIEEGASYKKVVEETEERIRDLGGEIAFPVNLSVNEVGAHDTADINDDRKIEPGLVKLDVGVHVDGYIGDTAVTVPVNTERKELIKASRKALENGLDMIEPGRKVSEVSTKIEQTIKDFGYNPIRNLTGHGLEQYDLHAKIEFPNVETGIDYELKEGDVFALEPFATDGAGKVVESNRTLILMWKEDKSVRSREGRKILKMAKKDFHKLPFAKRWLTDKVSKLRLNMSLRQLTDRNALHEYPVLREVDNGTISQAEHTVIVKDQPEVTTEI